MGVRARAVEMMEAALDLRLPEEQTHHVLGVFPKLLEDNRVTREGEVVAPHFVVRTIYKARYNLLAGLDRAHGFSPIEQQAYFGWLAFHAQSQPLSRRLQALDPYEQAGGQHAGEARAVLLFIGRRYGPAAAELQHAYERQPGARVRNYLMGARTAVRARN